MDPEVEARLRRSEASFNLRMDRAEERAKKADERMDKAEERAKKAEERMDRAEKLADARGAKFDQRLEATRKLVEAGMKIMVRMNTRLDEIAKSQKQILKSLERGRNGHGRL